MLILAQAITKSFGPVKVLRGADLQINEGDRIGLIGLNGAGKSTFLKILLGEIKPDTGELVRRTDKIGYLQQFAESSSSVTVREVLHRPYGHIESVEIRMHELDDMMTSGKDIDWNAVAAEYSDLEAQLAKFKVQDEDKLVRSLEKVGLSVDLMDRDMESLSGGERTKVMISRILVQAEECDLLVMDEPTSHLDIVTVEWLEDYIIKTHCAVLVISHDRYFLDKIATRMVEISGGKTREYKGNYTDFVDKKTMDVERMQKEYEKYANKKKHEEEVIDQMIRDCKYLSSHKSREKTAAKMEVKDRPEDVKDISVKMQSVQKSGKNVFLAHNLTVAYGDDVVLKNVEIDIQKGDKIGVFGGNGEGKSTLIKALLGQIPSTGELWLAPGAKMGYYSQHHEGLDLMLTAEEQLVHAVGSDRRGDARAMLSKLLLEGDDVEKPMKMLSGGQRAKVALSLLLLNGTNLLILDEPTNYLDIPAKNAMEAALEEYDGTVMVITHDRYFLDNICTRVIEVKDHTAITYAGNYSDMKAHEKPNSVILEAEEFRVLAPFTEWVTRKKFSKGDKVMIVPAEMKNYQAAFDQGKLKSTGNKRKITVPVALDDSASKESTFTIHRSNS